jgi:aldehyde dehydrogenase (NAD+)
VKPAEDASLTSLLLGHLALAVGFPPGALNVVTGLGHEAGAALAAHPGVGFLSFTGSPRVGILVQQAAALHYMPVALELGGKSPQIVFADADQDKALPVIVAAITQNAGQTCSAGSRLLLQDDIYDEFTEKLADRFKALTVGPGSMNADIGPVINRTQRTRIQEYIDLAQQDQLTFLAQGRLVANAPKDGYFVLPTLLGDVPARHRLAQEEIFGPVLTVTRFTSEDEAVAIANDTP